MDFLDPKKRRQHSIQLMIGYALVAIALALFTALLIYYSYGFGVNRKGELVQRGLVFVSSQPTGSQLYVDDKRANDTNTKLNLSNGQHKLVIAREGYHDWANSVDIVGSSVNRLDYPFLIPKKLTTESVKTYDTQPQLVTQSPDKRWIAVLQDSTTGTFELVDLDKQPDQIADTTSFSVPSTLISPSEGAHRWEVLEWADNNRHILLKHFYVSGGVEKFDYVLADKQRPEGSYNLSTKLGVTPTELKLRNKKPDTYYLYDSLTQELSTASIDNPTPEKILDKVLAYKTHGKDAVLYVTPSQVDPAKVNFIFQRGGQDDIVRSTLAGEKYLVDLARYDGDWYLAFGDVKQGRVYVYKDSSDTIAGINNGTKMEVAYTLRLDNPTTLSFSSTAQFIALQNAQSVNLYDVYNEKALRYNLPFAIDKPQPQTLWMDGARLTYVSSGKQIEFDYDGLNSHSLVDASTVFTSSFDKDFKYLYTFTPRKDGQAGLELMQTALRTNNDL